MIFSQDEIGFNTVKTSKRITRLLNHFLKPYKITAEQWSVLRQLSLDSNISQKELSERADKDQATLTKILDLLEQGEFILRKPNPFDRRSFLICMTDKGRSLTEMLFPFIEGFYNEIFKDIPQETLKNFEEVLNQIQSNIQKIKE